MKILKRLMSVLVATGIMLTTVSTVMAAELAAPASRTLTFDSFTENTNFTENGGNTSVTFTNAGTDKYTPINDAAGNVGALEIRQASSGSGNMMLTVTETGSRPQAQTNQYHEISFDFAYDGTKTGTRFAIDGTYNGTSTASSTYVIRLFEVNKDGRMEKCYGVSTASANVYFNKGSWNKVRLVLKVSSAKDTRSLWVYVNDVLVHSVEDTFSPVANKSGGTANPGFSSLFYGAYQIKAPKESTLPADPPVILLDNFTASTYTSNPNHAFSEISYGFDNLTAQDNVSAVNTELGKITKSGDIFFNKSELRTDAGHEAAVVGGIMGKESSDKALKLYQSAHPEDLSSLFNMYMPGYSETAGRDISPKVSQGNYEEIETYLAWDGVSGTKYLRGYYAINTGGNGQALNNNAQHLLRIDSYGVVYVMGTEVSLVKLIPNCWYKINLVFHSGDKDAASDADKNWVKLYINDELVTDAITFTPTLASGSTELSTFPGFKRLMFQITTSNSYNAYPTPNTYIDDVTVRCASSEITHTPVSVTYSNTYATNAMSDWLYGYVRGSEMTGATATSSNGTLQIVNGGSNAAAFTGGTDHFRITKTDGTKLYGLVSTDENVYVDKTSLTVSAGDVSETEITSYIGSKSATAATQTGVAGKEAGDSSVIVTAGSGTDPYIDIQASNINSGKMAQRLPYTIEMTVRMSGTYTRASLATTQESSTNSKNVITITDGKFYMLGTPKNIYYHNGEWVKLAVTVYPKKNKAEAFVNGKSIGGMQNLYDSGYGGLNKYRFQVVGTASSFNFGFDDLKIYNGVYQGDTDIEFSGTGFDIYNDGKVIFTEGNTLADFNTNVTDYSAQRTLFTDSTLSTVADTLKEGNILAVRNADGDIVKYYYVCVQTPCKAKIYNVSGLSNQNSGNKSLKIQARIFADGVSTARFIFANMLRNESELLHFAINDKSLGITAPDTTDAYFYPIDVEGDTMSITCDATSLLKAFIWDTDNAALSNYHWTKNID